MNRYPKRPRAVWVGFNESGEVSLTADEVLVPDGPESEDTGLLDAEGNKLYRVRERGVLGFSIP